MIELSLAALTLQMSEMLVGDGAGELQHYPG